MSNVYFLIHDKESTPSKTFYEKRESFKKFNQEGWGVYFAVNEFEATPKQMKKAGVATKRNKQFCTKLRYVFADLDIAKSGDGKMRQEKEELKEAVKNELLKKCEPTVIIYTSNGLQPLWELSDKSISEERIKLYTKVCNGIIEWSKTIGCKGDKVKDITRVLRLSGYYHQKEEPYLCELKNRTNKKYTLEQLEQIFPFEEEIKFDEKTYQKNNKTGGVIFEAIDNLDFRQVIIDAYAERGVKASFDSKGRVIENGRLTGTFQGKNGDRQYLASTSHDPHQGNKITAVADILQINNSEAFRWIKERYNLDYTKLVNNKIIEKQVNEIKTRTEVKKDYKLRYTWGTQSLDDNFAIIKRKDFIVVGSKRGTGKTTYTFDMACKNAIRGHKVLYLSLEMENKEIVEDFARKYAGITIPEERDYNIPEIKQKAFERKIKEIKDIKNLHFEGLRMVNNILWETLEKVIDKYENLDLIFIDNLDLINGNYNENEIDRQKRITKNIMNFTSDKNIPIVLIHHYRKKLSNSPSKDGMDELSGSGKIADNADRVLNIKRNKDPEASYPDNCESVLWLQKARGYRESMKKIFFIKGTFVDNAPIISKSYESKKIDFDKIF